LNNTDAIFFLRIYNFTFPKFTVALEKILALELKVFQQRVDFFMLDITK